MSTDDTTHLEEAHRLLQHAHPQGLPPDRLRVALPNATTKSLSAVLRRLRDHGKVRQEEGAWYATSGLPEPIAASPTPPADSPYELWQDLNPAREDRTAPIHVLVLDTNIYVAHPVGVPASQISMGILRAHRAYWLLLLLLPALTDTPSETLKRVEKNAIRCSQEGSIDFDVQSLLDQLAADVLLLPVRWRAGFAWCRIVALATEPSKCGRLTTWTQRFMRELRSDDLVFDVEETTKRLLDLVDRRVRYISAQGPVKVSAGLAVGKHKFIRRELPNALASRIFFDLAADRDHLWRDIEGVKLV